jgi:hypothetical protein
MDKKIRRRQCFLLLLCEQHILDINFLARDYERTINNTIKNIKANAVRSIVAVHSPLILW